jgi:hypothetical protein
VPARILSRRETVNWACRETTQHGARRESSVCGKGASACETNFHCKPQRIALLPADSEFDIFLAVAKDLGLIEVVERELLRELRFDAPGICVCGECDPLVQEL